MLRLLKSGVKRKNARFYLPVIHLWHKENELDSEKTMHMSPEEANQHYKEKNKPSGDRYRKELKDAKQLWTNLMDEDKQIKNWYKDFLKEVVEVKEREAYVVSQYQKEVFVS